ncbi:MAG TPA: tRNA-dihydrouridine synthase, partial [Rectinemataceae bacterium]
VKIRTGWDESSINYLDTAGAAAEAGAAAVTLHGRTRAQGYSGAADWNAIRTLVQALRPRGVPVFGSGDASDAAKAVRMLEETSCDGVMIARGAMGNPFVFAEAVALFRGLPYEQPDAAQIASVAKKHLERSIHFLGEKTACAEFRKQLCAYTKGRPGGAALRERAVRCSSPSEFFEVLEDFAR